MILSLVIVIPRGLVIVGLGAILILLAYYLTYEFWNIVEWFSDKITDWREGLNRRDDRDGRGSGKGDAP